MKQLIITFILVTIIGSSAYATAQYPDKIIYDGTEYALHSNPMEDYFMRFPEKKPFSGLLSTALWRGYVATFEVKDSVLYVKDIEIQVSDTTIKYGSKWKSVMNDVFPNQELVKVDWLSGLLVIPYGELVNYVHMGYGSTFENYILLEIDSGNLIIDKKFDYKEYEEFKEKQFQAYKLTEEYKKVKANLQTEGHTEEFIDSFLRGFVTKYTSKILVD